jgi:hypothetical protein
MCAFIFYGKGHSSVVAFIDPCAWIAITRLKRSKEIKAEKREYYSALDDFVLLRIQSTRTIE